MADVPGNGNIRVLLGSGAGRDAENSQEAGESRSINEQLLRSAACRLLD